MKIYQLFLKILLVMSLAMDYHTGWCQEIPQEEVEAPYTDGDGNGTFGKSEVDTPTCRMVPDSVPSRMKKEKAFAYANDATLWVKKQKKVEDNSSSGFIEGMARFFESRVVKNVFYLIVILAVIWIIYRLAVVNNLFVFSSRKKVTEDDADEALYTEGKIRERIEEAVRSGDYRLATRLLYIETLQWLDQLQLIRYQADATNQQYVQQMDRTPKGREFRHLTRVFDYVWYGKFPVSSDKFEVIRNNFKAFNQSAGH
jgi:hypothetical protein